MCSCTNGGANPYRMPAILQADDIETWLTGTSEQAWSALKFYDAGLMTAYPVSLRDNSSRSDEEQLLKRAEGTATS